RVSQDYLKKMRKQEPDSAVVWFPFQKENGFYHYPDELMEQMEHFLAEKLEEWIPKEKIFRWRE
ncbi:MAG TPA: DNA repair photolyase, partial [Lachnospiraceae bacterium]|nr:DNA repair photolyase [Lachnospiraceae bacterium]